ncbi:MAG: hypothetical protein ACO1RX_23495 [Candidatus Sericytochromatia bacterium]
MSEHPYEFPSPPPDDPPVHIHAHAEGLTITLPSVQNARRTIYRTVIVVNLIAMVFTLCLFSPLMNADAQGGFSIWGIFAVMLLGVNGCLFALRYQGFQRLSGSGRMTLNPYVFLMDEWLVPTHLIASVAYAPPQLKEYAGLRISLKDGVVVDSYLVQLFIQAESYQRLADSINTYLRDHQHIIDDASRSDPWRALPSLISPRKGRFPIRWQEGLLVIRPVLRWRAILWEYVYLIIFVLGFPYLIPKGFLNDLKDMAMTPTNLFFLGGTIFFALLVIALSFSSILSAIRHFSPPAFELSPEQLTVKTGKSLMRFPWREVKGFKLLETISGSSRNRRVHHHFFILHQDQEYPLIVWVNERDRIQELVWLKDIFERVWRHAKARAV